MINPMKLITKWIHFRIFEMGLDSNNKRPDTTLGKWFLFSTGPFLSNYRVFNFNISLLFDPQHKQQQQKNCPNNNVFFHLIFLLMNPFMMMSIKLPDFSLTFIRHTIQMCIIICNKIYTMRE